MKPTPTPTQEMMIEAYDAGLLNDFGGGDVSWWQDYLRAELERAHEFYASQFAALSVQPAAAVVGEPVDDWTVDDTKTAGEILTLLGIGCDASKEPGADWRRDKIAKLIRARISQQDAELERLRREVEATQKYAGEKSNQVAALIRELTEARKAAFIEAAEIAEETAQGSDHLLKAASHAKDIQGALVHGEGVMTARIIATALRRKAEEART